MTDTTKGALEPVTVEACAKVCEARIKRGPNGEPLGDWDHYAPYNAEDIACAKAIRALIGQPSPSGNAEPVAWLVESKFGSEVFLYKHNANDVCEAQSGTIRPLYAATAACASKPVTSTDKCRYPLCGCGSDNMCPDVPPVTHTDGDGK